MVFNDLLNWLKALDEKYALRVIQIDVSAAEAWDGESAAAGVWTGVGIKNYKYSDIKRIIKIH